MRKIIFLVVISFVFYQSCDDLNDISTVDLETDLTREIPVNIGENDPASVSESFTISALNDSEISRYKENIQNFEVKRVSYQILQYSGASGITMDGVFELGPVDVNVEGIDLEALSTSGDYQELDLFDSELQQLANEIDQKDEISGSISGTVSGQPVSFILKLRFDIGFRAKVL